MQVYRLKSGLRFEFPKKFPNYGKLKILLTAYGRTVCGAGSRMRKKVA